MAQKGEKWCSVNCNSRIAFPNGYAYNSSDIYTLNTSSSIRELLEDIKKEAHKWFDKIKEKAAAASDLEKNKIQLKTEVITTKRLLLVQ
jgi:hypothetical protein